MATIAEPAEAAPPRPHIGAYAWYALFVLVLVYIVNFVDRQIISILVGDIKRDLDVTDAQIGFLYGTAFAVFYALFGIPLGRLADSWYRGRLMAMGLTLWSSMTVFSGFATSFGALAAARIGVGIGEASASPAAYSMISDSFPKERRATALSIYSSGLYIGGALSLPIGGLRRRALERRLSRHRDRAARAGGLAGGLPRGRSAGAVACLVGADPARAAARRLGRPADAGREAQRVARFRPRAGRDPAAADPAQRRAHPGRAQGQFVGLAAVVVVGYGLFRLTGDGPQWLAYGLGVYAIFSWVQSLKHRDPPAYALIWGSPIVVLLAVAFGSISFVTYATSFWLPHYVEATFYAGGTTPSRYLTGLTAKAEVGLIIGTTAAISAAIGVILGGYISDVWRQRNPNGRLYLNMLSVLLPIPLVAFLLTTDSLTAFYWVNPLAHLFASAWVGAAVATLQDVVLPRMRATAGATYILGTTMVGLALGPYFAGKMSVLTGSLPMGIAALYLMPPLTLIGLAIAARHLHRLESTKVERARAAGEPI